MPVDSRPFLPVKALALPELTTSTRALPPARLARQKSTGADGHFERVKTPATSVPSSNTITSRSVRFLYLMPASAVAMRTPSIGGILTKDLGASGEMVVVIANSRREEVAPFAPDRLLVQGVSAGLEREFKIWRG